jgi:hypothetical protein
MAPRLPVLLIKQVLNNLSSLFHPFFGDPRFDDLCSQYSETFIFFTELAGLPLL